MASAGINLTAKKLRQVLSYDWETGIFKWRIKPAPRIRIGDVAGSDDGQGYIVIGYKGERHFAHRLAWLYMTGEWPTMEIDHEDTNPSNNKWLNLRDVPHSTNQHNHRRPQRNNQAGVLGVHYEVSTGRWRAQLRVGRRRILNASFVTMEEATAAYEEAKRTHHADAFEPNWGRPVPNPLENGHQSGSRNPSWAPI
jgi:hypothetical protein